ncbi:3',5'-cyclic adenosine monophosphate phosphodiesterase CpdA [Pedobacter sp. Bi27]|uniref:metallophosphoesterase family protein n=1 Tax=unclassified Pedobacter TaxID=2628915 RepID=UPI001D8567AD|nr:MULTISPECIES: metallophosphoesterase [unclassified Pedobacter]CAH0262413.1 3',5'-cyclic adenosine monophosphate phosphodiesterase CpdA [Pedobacter sp. Bi36]CAH0289128.1 3',5'-cyclic adenosine monophosphate phosphodiesterase CpdA [Pedobacter sp. Bi126]CAH0292506.1 3',5'-cyclic adenosine monophosphate phosphodiesterase CpdA [Pedobacter sp. Bi27]
MMTEIKRRSLLKAIGISAGAAFSGTLPALASEAFLDKPKGKKLMLTVPHITDVHIRAGENAPERFKACLKQIISKYKVDFFLNGGDSINDASYDNVVRNQVTEQWGIWDDCIKTIDKYEIHSCIGNHDTWWKAPTKEDEMYGKNYVVKRLKISNRYYSFSKKNWHFIILDGNNSKISLDDEQYNWLEQELKNLPAGTPTLLMSHYPILGTTQVLVGGGHSDCKKLKDLFYKHRDKVKICLSGHNHLSDQTVYNGVRYCCNGAMSGFWWGKGDAESAGPGYYLETPPGYAILKMYDDGTVENEYFPHTF